MEDSRVIGAADTLRRIRLETGGPAPIVTVKGKEVERHYEVPVERLMRIAKSTDVSLLRGPLYDGPSIATRAAGILGGIRTLVLLGEGCAAKITRALKEVDVAHNMGLEVMETNGKYVIRSSCSQARAESDFEAKGPRQFWLSLHGLKTICFTECKTIGGSIIVEKRLDELEDGEVFQDVKNVEEVCKRVDQSMGMNKKTTRYSEECRIGEAVDTDFCRKVVENKIVLRDDDFRKVSWAPLEFEKTTLVIEWKRGIETCVVDTLGYGLSVTQIRLPFDEPDHLRFINIRGTDVDVDTSSVNLPVGQGFRSVDFGETYCYLQNHRIFVGRFKRVGNVGRWHQTLSGISFEGDGYGILGGV